MVGDVIQTNGQTLFDFVLKIIIFVSVIEPEEAYAKVGEGSAAVKCSILENSKYYLQVHHLCLG